MVVGISGAWLFVVGLRGATSDPHGQLAFIWLFGAAIVFVLAAEHCATPHDYYYLVATPPLIFFCTRGFRQWYEKQDWRRPVALTLVLTAPIYGYLRVAGRYEDGGHFHELRAAVTAKVPPNAKTIALDEIPGYLLYRTGLQGDRRPKNFLVNTSDLGQKGFTHIVTFKESKPKFASTDTNLSELPVIVQLDGIEVYKIP